MPLARSSFQQAEQRRDSLLESGADHARPLGASAEQYGRWLAEQPPYQGYRHVPTQCKQLLERIVADRGTAAGERFLQLVAAHEILALEHRLVSAAIPPTVMTRIEHCIQRLLADLAAPRAGYFRHEHDPFVKDLAVCRLKLLPCGIEMVDVSGGFSRSDLWTHGLAVAWALGKAMAGMGGNKPLLAGHLDRRAMRELNREGFVRFYRTVADLLRVRPHIRGFVGDAWLLDPVLKRISPELAYVRELPESGGAVFYPTVDYPNMVSQALAFSACRRALYESGEYRPRAWRAVWPRRALIEWADRQPSV